MRVLHGLCRLRAADDHDGGADKFDIGPTNPNAERTSRRGMDTTYIVLLVVSISNQTVRNTNTSFFGWKVTPHDTNRTLSPKLRLPPDIFRDTPKTHQAPAATRRHSRDTPRNDCRQAPEGRKAARASRTLAEFSQTQTRGTLPTPGPVEPAL